jgi:hypothetical protein
MVPKRVAVATLGFFLSFFFFFFFKIFFLNFFFKNKKFNQVFTCQLLIGQRVSPLSQLTVNWTNLVTF